MSAETGAISPREAHERLCNAEHISHPWVFIAALVAGAVAALLLLASAWASTRAIDFEDEP
jgi:hypothetical protein